ncbi:hypothetical protein EMIT051CA3_60042 [Pseudomonas chlororaphis]
MAGRFDSSALGFGEYANLPTIYANHAPDRQNRSCTDFRQRPGARRHGPVAGVCFDQRPGAA